VDPQQLNLHPPRDWQVFEDLCHALWEREWRCPTIQKHGRSGQPQRGVDIFGKPNGGAHYHGIQCKAKAKSGADGKIFALVPNDIRREVEEAQTFDPPLEKLIIATTAPSEVNIQGFVRKLSEEHLRQGLFSIDVLAWPEIVARVARHEDVLERFYPGATARWRGMARKVDETHRLVIASVIGAVLLVVMAIDVFFGRPWPSAPEIHPHDTLNGSTLRLPFTIKNTSIFPILSAEMTCGIDWVFFKDAQGQSANFVQMAFVNDVLSIDAGHQVNYECDASQLIKINQDGSLQIRTLNGSRAGLGNLHRRIGGVSA